MNVHLLCNVQYTTCAVINFEEKNSIFLNPVVLIEVFSSKNSTKYHKKVTLGISVFGIQQLQELTSLLMETSCVAIWSTSVQVATLLVRKSFSRGEYET